MFRRLEHAHGALVAGEQARQAARSGRVHREQCTGHIDHPCQLAVIRHVQAVVVLGRQIQIGEAAMAELGRQRGVATNQLSGCETMALGLQDVMVVNCAELADRTVHWADEVSRRDWAQAWLERTGEELVEAPVARDLRIFCFAHVDAILAHKLADQAGRC